jgi:hypothetical protein
MLLTGAESEFVQGIERILTGIFKAKIERNLHMMLLRKSKKTEEL